MPSPGDAVCREVEQLLRLPLPLARQVLGDAAHRQVLVQALLDTQLVVFSAEEQISVLKLLMQHNDLFLLDEDPPVDSLLLHFAAEPVLPQLLPLLECLLLNWQAHVSATTKLFPAPSCSSSRPSPSPLAAAFSAHFRRDMRGPFPPLPLTPSRRAEAIQEALRKLERCATEVSSELLAQVPSISDSSVRSLPVTRCGQYRLPLLVLPSSSPPPFTMKKRKKNAEGASVESTPKGGTVTHERGEDTWMHPVTDGVSETRAKNVSAVGEEELQALITTTAAVSSQNAATNRQGELEGEQEETEPSKQPRHTRGATADSHSQMQSQSEVGRGTCFSSTAAKRELTALLRSKVGGQRSSSGSDVAKQLCDQLDSAFSLVCAPLLLGRGGDETCVGSAAVATALQDAALFYSLAVKTLRLLDCHSAPPPPEASDEVFSELVALYLSPQHLDEQELAAGEGAVSGGGASGKSSAWRKISVLFFLSAVVQGRLRAQLAPSSSAPASRRLMRAIESCCALWPAETVELVLAPCLLPPPQLLPVSSLVSDSNPLATSPSSKHLYEVVTRVIRQGLLPVPFVDRLFELVFALPCTIAKEVEVSSVALPPALQLKREEVSEEEEPWGWDRTGGSSSLLLAGLLVRIVTARMHMQVSPMSLSVLQCEEQLGGLRDLLFWGAGAAVGASSLSTVGIILRQPSLPLAEIDCLKCLSSMLIPLLSKSKGKSLITTKPLRLLLLRLDEVSSSPSPCASPSSSSVLPPSSVAPHPLTANLLHALVTANKHSGGALLRDCLEELQAVLARGAPRSVVARHALAEVTKQQAVGKRS